MKFKKNILFIVIALIGFLLRFWQLNNFPVSLNWDEVSHGFNAYSLLKTGKDQWSNSWPLFNFRAYGDYPTTLNMYLSLPFIYFFGLNVWTTRIVSALAGFSLVIVSYFIGKQLFKNKKASYLLMFLVTISPWTFFSSRAVFQSTVAQAFFALGFLFLLKARKKIKYLLPASIFMAISTYAYHNTKIVVPLLLFVYFIIFFKEIVSKIKTNKKIFITTFLVLLFLIVPQIVNTFNNKDAQARSRWVFIINPTSIGQIENLRNNYQGDQFIAKLKYNRPVFFTTTVIKNYLGFVNPKILFFNSTQNFQFNIPQTGVLYPICLPFFYLGLAFLVFKIFKKDKLSIFLIFSFVIGLIPAVITTGDFPIIRAMSILPLPYIFIVYGVIKTFSILKNKKIKTFLTYLFLITLILQSFIYLKNYFTNYAKNYSQSWQYGYKEAVDYVKENYNQYDQIIITKKYGEAHEFFLFYWPWDPESYQNDPKLDWDFHANWYWVNAFDKFKFINDWEIKDKTINLSKNTLLITSPNNYNESNTKLIKTINFLDDTPAFQILETKP